MANGRKRDPTMSTYTLAKIMAEWPELPIYVCAGQGVLCELTQVRRERIIHKHRYDPKRENFSDAHEGVVLSL